MEIGNGMNKNGDEARRHIWRHRGRRYASGMNVFAAVGLAAALFVIVNYAAHRYVRLRWDIGSGGYYELSDRTRTLLATLTGRLKIVAFLQKQHELYDDARFLLKEYEHAAEANPKLDLQVKILDPDRDLAEAAELSRFYEVEKANTIVFECGERRAYVDVEELMDYERAVDYQALMDGKPAVTRRKVGFRGEQIFSSAIMRVSQPTAPVVYFLGGHGEHDPNDFSDQGGYSQAARILRRDNIEVRSLLLAGQGRVPADCSLLVIAGPDRRISEAEIDQISAYLDKNGRALVLADAGRETGLEALLAGWGVKLGRDVVVGLTLTGRELFVTDYGDHPVTRRFRNVTVMLYRPRSVEPAPGAVGTEAAAADRPGVTVLARSTAEGWAEADLGEVPAKFDPAADRIGPIGVAVAVEKGLATALDVEIRPTRMVVVGDSDFVSNGALKSGVGGNTAFFLSAVNWLLEREALMGIAPKVPGVLELNMNRVQIRTVFLILVAGIPAMAAVIGLIVGYRRRR